MTITKREIIASAVIIAVMMIVGFAISENIQQNLLEKYQEYDTAVQITDEELFRHGMKTNIGNAFVYGDLKTIDPVTFPEVGGEYSYIEKEEQEYTQHSRTVTRTYTDEDGNTHTETDIEYYWTWDTVNTESKKSTKISFLNVEFDYSKISFLTTHEITTLDTGYHTRNVYYGKGTECKGTIFTVLKNNTISETSLYDNLTITETIEQLESGYQLVIFWIFWIIAIVIAVVAFYYIENKWLE